MGPEIVEGSPGSQNKVPLIAVLLALGIIPLNFVICMQMWGASKDGMWIVLFTLLALGQLVLGVVALVSGILHRRKYGQGGVAAAVLGALAALGAPLGWMGGVAVLGLGAIGGAWGRPLRVRGRQLHPELKAGTDWTRGERPDGSALDDATRRALEALWLHDAQKEHASVPAFSRVSWLLAAAGAPAELLEWSHRAALEEIEHTRRCFALAAGYAGGKSHTVEPMPDLLLGGLEVNGNALVLLATESLSDGCQLEDYNADVAAACAQACEEPVTKRVLELIAREERTHADFSWAVISWLLAHDRDAVAPALEAALAKLDAYPRPTAVSADKLERVARADPAALRRHGRLPDTAWAQLWHERLNRTRARLTHVMHSPTAAVTELEWHGRREAPGATVTRSFASPPATSAARSP